MSKLNKIFYGSAGTGKTREANIEAVKIIHKSEKLDFNFNKDDYSSILSSFRSFSETQKLNLSSDKTKEIHNMVKVDNIKLYPEEIERLTNGTIKSEAISIIKSYKEKLTIYPLIETVTFHPSYSYQDFVEGITIDTIEVEKNNKIIKEIIYTVKDGIFKKICDRARANKGYQYVLIIDEINRGDISSIFGELFTLLEDTKREGEDEALSINLPYSKDKATGNPKKLIVPSNLHIVATMNTVDKSIALIDVALRRRFEFIEMKPKYELLSSDIEGINLEKMLEAINERISILKNEHYQIGHSYFLEDKITNFSDLKNVMTKNIIPLLQEYFYDDWRSVCAVLNQSYDKPIHNKGIFDIKKANEKMFASEFNELIEFNNKKIVTIRNFEHDDIKDIYQAV